MKKLTAALAVACVAVLLPCVANGAGNEGGKQPDDPAATPGAMISTNDGAAVSTRVGMPGGGARDAVRNRPGIDLRSVETPKDLANTLSLAPMAPPSAEYWLSVSGANFVPRSSTPAVYSSWGCSYTTDGALMTAQVFLPDGAKIVELWLNYYRTGAYSSTAYLEKYPYQGTSTGFTNILPTSATSTAGTASDITAGGTEVVDNAYFSYTFLWTNTGNVNNRLCSMQVGYTMPPTGTYNPITPCRQITPIAVTSTQQNLQLTGGACGVPAGATGVTANVTTFNANGTGWLAIWPQGLAWPGNSTVNYSPGLVVANSADLVLSSSGMVSAKCQSPQTVQMILDITGYFY